MADEPVSNAQQTQPAATPTSSIGGDLIDAMPQLKKEVPGATAQAAPGAPNPIEQPVQPSRSRYAHLRDAEGNSYDPKLHQNNHGRPKLSKKGLLKKWVGPRRGGGEASQADLNFASKMEDDFNGMIGKWDEEKRRAEEEKQKELLKLSPEQRAQASRALATVTAAMFFNLSVALGGEEWIPQTNAALGLDERANVERALGDYFIATGRMDLPPGWALAIALGGYALPRFFMPKTKSRLAVAVSWFKNKISGLNLWRQRRAQAKAKSAEK